MKKKNKTNNKTNKMVKNCFKMKLLCEEINKLHTLKLLNYLSYFNLLTLTLPFSKHKEMFLLIDTVVPFSSDTTT